MCIPVYEISISIWLEFAPLIVGGYSLFRFINSSGGDQVISYQGSRHDHNDLIFLVPVLEISYGTHAYGLLFFLKHFYKIYVHNFLIIYRLWFYSVILKRYNQLLGEKICEHMAHNLFKTGLIIIHKIDQTYKKVTENSMSVLFWVWNNFHIVVSK